jgi:hypothetical protein
LLRIIAALAKCGGNQKESARLLGISRGTLVSRLAEYRIPRPRKHRFGSLPGGVAAAVYAADAGHPLHDRIVLLTVGSSRL